jgi:hypothetical protein
MEGNTRIKVLEERGVNVNTMERIILEIPKEANPMNPQSVAEWL